MGSRSGRPDGARPLIVVPARFSASAAALRYRAEVAAAALVAAVHAAGGEALVIHPDVRAEDPDGLDREVRERLWLADGVLLPGGGDLSPRWAGQAVHATQYDVDETQDAFDLAVARVALEDRIPLLSICRGTQVVNVARGGDLVQELGETVGADHRHLRHEVELVADTALSGLLGRDRLLVSCYHHQGIATLGRDLRAAAYAEDGTVEAVTLADHAGWYLGVQWHPEDTAAADPLQARIFTGLVDAAARPADAALTESFDSVRSRYAGPSAPLGPRRTMDGTDPGALEAAEAGLKESGLDVVRLGYSDLIGAERGRDILVSRFARTVGDGVAFCRSVYATSPMGDVVDIAGGLSAGLPDVVAFPDLDSIRPIPWEPGVAHVIADVFNPDGTPSQESPRNVLRRVLDRFAAHGMTPTVGPELEFFLLEPSPESPVGWKRYGEATGNVYTAGRKGDPENTLLLSLRQLAGYGLDVVAANHEFSSGQFEINLWHSEALDAADRAFRFKTAVQEIARLHGKLATFMAKPFNDEGGSGFHIHFSTWSEDGRPLFDDPAGEDGLSSVARAAVAGVLRHAPALTALLNPTVNSYKRFGPDTLAPWLIDWGLDNRSAMVRIPPERGRAARMEVRLGDASANPYLAVAALLAAAHLGIDEGLEPPAKLEGYGYDPTKADRLPADLSTALDALEADTQLTELLGPEFVATFVAYKRNEIDRFQSWVTDWEFREYSYHL